MKQVRERRGGRLFPFPVYGKWWVFAGLLIIAISFQEEILLVFKRPQISFKDQVLSADSSLALDGNQQTQRPELPSKVSSETKAAIEGLFAEIQKNPENKEDLLLNLKRILQITFEGQEDCWSCEGTVYFDRYDEIAGQGEARKPLGFREWIELGDEALAKNETDEARKFYSLALQVIDERAPDTEDPVDTEAISRVREKCQQLDCR